MPPAVGAFGFPPAVALHETWTGLHRPVYLTHDADPSRLYVVEQDGRVRLIADGSLQPKPVLDVSDRVSSAGSEQGLLSVAFPPSHQKGGTFYVNYTDVHGSTTVSRFRVLQGDPHRADPASEQVILRITQPAANHNGGQLQFGPDGYLYVGMGDGGRAGDPWGNAQNPASLLGKMLRLDVSSAEAYRIPPDNPFVGQDSVRPEIWGLGLRNPWRFSFDRATGDLYIADVGQNRFEEVHFHAFGSPAGVNYGWDIMEGRHCFEPASDCDRGGLMSPVAEYDHSLGCSVTGGIVYRGSHYPQLDGVYFYGDFCSGNIWGLRRDPSGEWSSALLLRSGLNISSFGEDSAGEVFVLDYQSGSVFHLVVAE
jgi:glucose/arabinose dehydrogenase